LKLSHSIPLDGKITEAIAEIDFITPQKLVNIVALERLYAEKAALAAKVLTIGGVAPDWLLNEANSKKIGVAALCQSILDKAQSQPNLHLLLESARQEAKAKVRQATSEQAIGLAVEQFRLSHIA